MPDHSFAYFRESLFAIDLTGRRRWQDDRFLLGRVRQIHINQTCL